MDDKVHVPGLKDRRRYETQKAQRDARKEGVVHPRSLARSVAKAYCRSKSIPESECGTYFRELARRMPKRGRKYLYSDAERAARRGRRIMKKA